MNLILVGDMYINLGIEKLLGYIQMPVEVCRELAVITANNTMEFTLVCPDGSDRVKWLDASNHILNKSFDKDLKACYCIDIFGIGDL